MTYLTALWFAALQGITELFPVSSVAHAVLLPAVFPLRVDLEGLLPFTVMLHLGTALALLLFYWRDWWRYAWSLFDHTFHIERQVLIRLVVGTFPAAFIGFIFLKALRNHFTSAKSAAFFLIVNGLIMLLADRKREHVRAYNQTKASLTDAKETSEHAGDKRTSDREIAELGFLQSLLIGTAQSLALIPGFSRSGMTMVAGLFAGLSYAAAARFTFLLATPVILGAGVVEVPRLFKPEFQHLMAPSLVGGLAAGIAAYVSVWILTRYFHQHEVQAFLPFAIYCILVGSGVLLYLSFLA